MKARGSITVFLALVLVCVFSAMFGLLEAARVSGLRANVRVSTMQAEDTVMASYQRELWDRYGLLFWQEPQIPELSGLKQLQREAIEGNQMTGLGGNSNYYMLQVHMTEVEVPQYELATDHQGKAFRQQAARRMKETVAEDALEALLHTMEQSKASEEVDEGTQIALEDKAVSALEQLESAGDTGSDASGEHLPVTSNSSVQVKENPLEWAKKMRKNGIYGYLLSEGDVSVKAVELQNSLSRRQLQQGNMEVPHGQIWEQTSEKALFQLYLDKYFTDYTSHEAEDQTPHALDYELEYMIGGKASDKGNLNTVIQRLILMREATNLAYLEKDPRKLQEVSAVAATICTAFAQPELEPLVQQGILAAWAYGESLYDVKQLLHGEKIPLMKTQGQWHTQITNMTSSMEEMGTSSGGLTYRNYLQILMWMIPSEKLSMRAMDLMEQNTGVKMDQMVSRAHCEYTYEAKPLFWNYVLLEHTGSFGFRIFQWKEQREITY